MEKEFILLKPDAVQRGLIGELISRFEKRIATYWYEINSC